MSPWSLTPSLDLLSFDEYPLLVLPPPDVEPLHEPLRSSAKDAQDLLFDDKEPSDEDEDEVKLPDPDVLPSLKVSSFEICDPVMSSEMAVRNSPVIGPGTFHNKITK